MDDETVPMVVADASRLVVAVSVPAPGEVVVTAPDMPPTDAPTPADVDDVSVVVVPSAPSIVSVSWLLLEAHAQPASAAKVAR
jgi:hypothetical protein